MKKNSRLLKAYLIFFTIIIIFTIFYQMMVSKNSEPYDGSYIREYIFSPYEIIEIYSEYKDDIIKYGTYNLKGTLSQKSEKHTYSDLIERGWVFRKLPIPMLDNQNGGHLLDTNVPFDKDLISTINKYDYYWYYSDGTFTSLELSERFRYSNFDFTPIGNKLLIVLVPTQNLVYLKRHIP